MEKRKKYAVASGAALLLALGGTAIVAGPAMADTGAPAVQTSQTQVVGHEDGTNDSETADDQNEANDPNEAGGETADDAGTSK